MITQADTIDAFPAHLGDHYDRYTAGTVMLETADRLVAEEKQPSLQQFLLLVGGLRAMTAGERAPAQVLDSYLLRSLAVAGYAPSFTHCARCGDPGAARLVLPGVPAAPCARTAGCPARPRRRPGRSSVMGALLAGDWPAVAAADPRQLREASGLVAAFLHWHLERGLRSLEYVERCAVRPARVSTAEVPAQSAPSHSTARQARRRPLAAGWRVKRAVRRPNPHPSGPGRRDPARARPAARRDHHGRQRPLGQGTRPAAHQGPRDGARRRSSTWSRARSRSA